MSSDVFGDLREWGETPRQLQRLSETGSLSQHEAGLVGMLQQRSHEPALASAVQQCLQTIGGLCRRMLEADPK